MHNITINAFIDEIEKNAAPGIMMGAVKSALPWTLGMHAIENITSPPHLSLQTPQQKAKDLGVSGLGMIGEFAAWDAGSKAFGKIKPINKAYNKLGGNAAKFMSKGSKWKTLPFKAKLGRFGLAVPKLAAGYAAYSLASWLRKKIGLTTSREKAEAAGKTYAGTIPLHNLYQGQG